MNRSILILVSVLSLIAYSKAQSEERKPNIIVILADDLGYGDLSCYGADDIATPNIDRMATDGTRLTSFYVSPVCSPTRASLMTGCFAQRVGIGGVLFPRNNHGLNPDERTLPELLREQGYATAIVGKWHLGNQDLFQPLNHGFDTWYGTPASNSQSYDPTIKRYADDCVFREGYTRENILNSKTAACPLIRDNLVIEVPADQTLLTKRYTRETIRYITANKDQPFFLYLAHNMPHIPLHASEEFAGSSKRGIYGDTIQEIDWSTGEILRTLKELGIDDKTLVIFLSDNGPNLSTGGRAGALRGGKGSSFEGGVRVPCVARWPGTIAAGTETDEPATGMDLLPTLIQLAGGKVPDDRAIDGKDIWPLLAGQPDAKSPHEAIFYLKGRGIHGIRVGDWKYLMAADQPRPDETVKRGTATGQKPKNDIVEALYNLSDDLGEQNNLAAEHPEVVAGLKKRMEDFRRALRKNTRPAAVASSNQDEE